MASTIYDIGDRIRLSAVFTNESGVPTDPTTTTLLLRDPAGNETSPTPTSVGSGAFRYDFTFDQAGKWHYRWKGTGAVETAAEGELVVRRSAFDTP